MKKNYVVMDGNTAAAYSAYAFTEVVCALIFQYRLINKEMISETIAPAMKESIQFGIPKRYK